MSERLGGADRLSVSTPISVAADNSFHPPRRLFIRLLLPQLTPTSLCPHSLPCSPIPRFLSHFPHLPTSLKCNLLSDSGPLYALLPYLTCITTPDCTLPSFPSSLSLSHSSSTFRLIILLMRRYRHEMHVISATLC